MGQIPDVGIYMSTHSVDRTVMGDFIARGKVNSWGSRLSSPQYSFWVGVQDTGKMDVRRKTGRTNLGGKSKPYKNQ